MLRAFAFVTFLLVAVGFNWPLVYHEVLDDALGGSVALLPSVTEVRVRSTTMVAGWPARYYLVNSAGGHAPLSSFSLYSLLLNTAFWSALGAGIVLYRKIFKRKAAPENDPKKRSRRTTQLSDIFAATAIIAAAFGYWQAMRYRGNEDRALASRIANSGGAVVRYAMLPAGVREVLRIGGFSGYLRTRDVRLSSPDDALLKQVAALPNLRTLNIAGGTYSFDSLAQLARSTQLEELGIVGRELDATAIKRIRSIRSLQKINLMRTNITAKGVAAFREMPRLVDINLVHTDVQLSELTPASFPPTLVRLALPHPAPGIGDALVLDGCPNLTELSCFEYDELINDSPVSLTLRNMPKLRKLEVDLLQLVDLDFENLPELKYLQYISEGWERRTSLNQVVPSSLWVRNLQTKNVSQLTEIEIFAANLESLSVDVRDATVDLQAYNASALREGFDFDYQVARNSAGPGFLTDQDMPLEMRQKWIDDIGNSSGIKVLSIATLPLKGVNLSPLTKNKSIKQLSIDRTGLQSKQINAILKEMDQLDAISLLGLEVDGAMVESLAKSMPNLKQILCDRSAIQRLRLEHVPNLELVYGVPKADPRDPYRFVSSVNWNYLDALRLVDVPVLADYFESNSPMQHLHIDSAPALTGLSFAGALPPNAVIKGVRDLKFFAAGGATCTDAIVADVLGCNGLQKLTLAYAPISAESIQKIAQLRELEYLVLTGTAVDDNFIATLAGLTKLKTLRLDRTKMTRAAVEAIAKLTTLEDLALGGIELTEDDTLLLAKSLSQLKNLDVSGSKFSSDAMKAIANLPQLVMLDLSQCAISQDLLMSMAQNAPRSLKLLKLNASQIDETGLASLIRALPELRFELNGTEVSPQLTDYLVSQSRLIDPDEGTTISFIQSNDSATIDEPKPGEIDPSVFAPISDEELAAMEQRRQMRAQSRMGSSTLGMVAPMSPLEGLGYGLAQWLLGSNPYVHTENEMTDDEVLDEEMLQSPNSTE